MVARVFAARYRRKGGKLNLKNDLAQWIAGNPTDVLATNFGKPAALFERFPRNDVFISSKDGP